MVISRNLNDRFNEAAYLDYLGVVYRRQNKYAQAIDYHQQSLALFRQLKTPRSEAIVLCNLGMAYLGQEGYEQALNSFQTA
ncbi:tetratricopeptide repeat protein [Floridanema aerugineum]|uniref:Tetratricopeptide repeat protein n=1 Tax=Floridaenema aerugineum BLCC-F46 TaxID=3153654 RepID=A0ABV4XEA9_9CYAN